MIWVKMRIKFSNWQNYFYFNLPIAVEINGTNIIIKDIVKLMQNSFMFMTKYNLSRISMWVYD